MSKRNEKKMLFMTLRAEIVDNGNKIRNCSHPPLKLLTEGMAMERDNPIKSMTADIFKIIDNMKRKHTTCFRRYRRLIALFTSDNFSLMTGSLKRKQEYNYFSNCKKGAHCFLQCQANRVIPCQIIQTMTPLISEFLQIYTTCRSC